MPGPTIVRFANTTLSRGFNFTFGPGVQPSTCLIETVPHTQSLPNVGELRFETVGEAPFVFRDCLLEQPRLIASEQGQYWALPIKDRRWKWQFGYIHGSYNVPRSDGSYLREASPKQLASILLAAMGETSYDVDRLPNDTRPEIEWNGHNPAAELDRLCQSLGCIVVLNPITDRTELWPGGDGATLPGGPTRGSAYAPVYPAQPHDIRIEAGDTLFQATFQTTPVGLDTDGTWKKLIDLSYTPPGGWPNASPINGYSEQQIPGTYSQGGRTLKKCDLATATAYRCYQVVALANKSPFNPGQFVPPLLQGTEYEPESARDVRLFDYLVDEELSADGGLRPLSAIVYARWYRTTHATPANPIRYDSGFHFDSTHNILIFNEPLFLTSTQQQTRYEPAVVRYECAFLAGKNGLFHRHLVEQSTGSNVSTPKRLIQRPDIRARVVYRYSTDNTFTTEQNLADTTQRLNYWGNAAQDEYGLQNGGTVNYEQLIPLSPDGLTQQITWSGGGRRPPRTTVSQAQRHNRFVPPLDEQRDRLAAKQAQVVANQIKQFRQWSLV